MTDEPQSKPSDPDDVEQLRQRLGPLDPRQVAIWRQMSGARRLELAFQAYQFALEAVRAAERRRQPDLPGDVMAWRVIWRMHGDFRLGRPAQTRTDG